jgi:hypothetical protein
MAAGSAKCAGTGDGSADDHRVDPAGALVGLDRLGVGDEQAHLFLGQNAFASAKW